MTCAPSFYNIYLLTIIHPLLIQNPSTVDVGSKDTTRFLKSEDQSGKRLYHEKLSQIIFSPSLFRNRSTPTRKSSRETSPSTRHYSSLGRQPEEVGILADALQGQLRIGSSEETEGTMRQLLRGLEDRGHLWEESMIAPHLQEDRSYRTKGTTITSSLRTNESVDLVEAVLKANDGAISEYCLLGLSSQH